MFAALATGVLLVAVGQTRNFNAVDLSNIRVGPSVSTVAVSQDGEWVAIADFGGIRVVRASTGQVLRTWTAHLGEGEYSERCQVTALVFIQGGKQLVSAGMDTRISVWDTLTGECTLVIDEPWIYRDEFFIRRVPLSALAISPDEKYVAASAGTSIQLWNLGNGQRTGEIGRTCTREPYLVEPSTDSVKQRAGSESGRDWLLWKFPPGPDGIGEMAFSPDGLHIVTEQRTDTSVWSVATRECVLDIKDADLPHWVSDRQLAVSVSDTEVQLFDIERGGRSGTAIEVGSRSADSWPFGVLMRGTVLAAAVQNRVILFDIATGKQLTTYRVGDLNIDLAACSCESLTFVTRTSDSNYARVWRFVELPSAP